MNDSVPPTSELLENSPTSWDEFWYRPTSAMQLQRLRLLTAAVMLIWFASWLGPGAAWLNADGIVTPSTTAELSAYWIQTRLVGAHPYHWVPLVGVIAAGLWAFGKFGLVPATATWMSMLAIVHRIPMVTGRFEALLAALAGYLLFASFAEPARPSARARIVTRLIQLHLSAFLFITGLQQLGGSEVWWNGEAAWWLAASEPERLLDFTALHRLGLLLDAATLYGAIYPLAAALMIWRWRRQWVLAIGLPYWFVMGAVTGEWMYFALLPVSLYLAFAREESTMSNTEPT